MKKIFFITIMLLAFILTSCLFNPENPNSQNLNESNSNLINSEIFMNEEEAIEILRTTIQNDESALKIEIEESFNENDETFFSVHAYYYDNFNEDEGISYTVGWFKINRKNGQVFKRDLSSNSENDWILCN